MSETIPRSARYWLMKSEPDVFSIDDLKRVGCSFWDGVRNYMARNYMTQGMEIGDLVLFYHSNAKPSGVVGLARVASKAKPDPTAFDKKSDYFDPKTSPEKPRWYGVDVEYVEKFIHELSLDEIKKLKPLKEMVLLKNSRLSVQPVTQPEFDVIYKFCAERPPSKGAHGASDTRSKIESQSKIGDFGKNDSHRKLMRNKEL